MAELKVVLVHLNPMSARLSFWIDTSSSQATGCLPNGFSPLAALIEGEVPNSVIPHPAAYLNAIGEYLGIEDRLLEIASPELAWVETPDSPVPVALLRIMTTDLPQPKASGRFISLMELRLVPVVERLLLKKAYEFLLGD